MPLRIDENDIAIIKSLLNNGRKSFRQISRETGITTPTVKARYERLVNVGFLKGVIPIFDFSKVDNSNGSMNHHQQQQKEDILVQIQSKIGNSEWVSSADEKTHSASFENEISYIKDKITNGLAINLICDFCEGPIFDKPKILKYADIERFFCCTSCKSNYSVKYMGRIESIKRKYEGKSEIDE
ncbi:MAG: AsnC family transcriptional regulator [Thermoproteota archaeon]|nr:AsnC family transcriptional regulator [Thermoproteota archaeon]